MEGVTPAPGSAQASQTGNATSPTPGDALQKNAEPRIGRSTPPITADQHDGKRAIMHYYVLSEKTTVKKTCI